MIGFVVPPNILKEAINAPQPKRRMKLWHWALLAALYLFFCWWFLYPALVRYIPDQPTAAERADFQRRARYHGLDKQALVTIEEQGKTYFYRNGRKCRF